MMAFPDHYPAVILVVVFFVVSIFAQDAAVQVHTFHAPEGEVEKALEALHAARGGKLPILEGFVSDAGDSLNRYEHGYYQYSWTVVPVSAVETSVRVSAKITAWYKDASDANSGYRVLASNGRLESDLFENIEDRLKSAHLKTPAGSSSTPGGAGAEAVVPDSPSRVENNLPVFATARSTASVSNSEMPSAHQPQDRSSEQRAQQLIQQGNSLREILSHQTRPDNLAVIKAGKTAILDRPMEGSKVVLVADEQDEFQIVNLAGDWVHVQLSGISRGWLRRELVELPSPVTGTLSTLENDPRTFDRAPPFQQTREEISVFPGKWQPLDGKKVEIIWVQPSNKKAFGAEPKLRLVKSVLHKNFSGVSAASPPIAGVVVILDSEDGGMAATTMAALQQWQAGHLPDGAFWKRCLLDPADAFKAAE